MLRRLMAVVAGLAALITSGCGPSREENAWNEWADEHPLVQSHELTDLTDMFGTIGHRVMVRVGSIEEAREVQADAEELASSADVGTWEIQLEWPVDGGRVAGVKLANDLNPDRVWELADVPLPDAAQRRIVSAFSASGTPAVTVSFHTDQPASLAASLTPHDVAGGLAVGETLSVADSDRQGQVFSAVEEANAWGQDVAPLDEAGIAYEMDHADLRVADAETVFKAARLLEGATTDRIQAVRTTGLRVSVDAAVVSRLDALEPVLADGVDVDWSNPEHIRLSGEDEEACRFLLAHLPEVDASYSVSCSRQRWKAEQMAHAELAEAAPAIEEVAGRDGVKKVLLRPGHIWIEAPSRTDFEPVFGSARKLWNEGERTLHVYYRNETLAEFTSTSHGEAVPLAGQPVDQDVIDAWNASR